MTAPIRTAAAPRLLSAACLMIASLMAAPLLALLVSAAAPAPALAQDQDLVDRLNRLQQELKTLQSHVYGGGSGSSTTSSSGAADLSKPLAARLELRLNQLEDEMRRLTGRIEELNFRVQQVGQLVDSVSNDFDQRLRQLEQGAAPTTGALPTDGGTAAQDQGGELSGASGTTAGRSPQVLGTVGEQEVANVRSQGVTPPPEGTVQSGTGQAGAAQGGTQQAALPADATPKAQYDYAFGLLSQANYPAAEQALLSFLQDYPQDPLAGNAKYWLGETYYVRGQYRDAAVTFAEGFQSYPNSSKAPDNLLKLGKSLAALGQTADACGTLSELQKRYPQAPATIQQQAKGEQQRLACQ